jgi:hypothetical protein
MKPVGDAALAGESVGNPEVKERDRCSGFTALIREDDRDSQVSGHHLRDFPSQPAEVPEQPVFAARIPAREIWPGRRDDREIDEAAIGIPNTFVDHVRTDCESDTSPGSRHDQGFSSRVESEPFPEDEVSLSVHEDGSIRAAEP